MAPGWAVSNITCHAQDRDVSRIVHGLEAAGRFREQLVNCLSSLAYVRILDLRPLLSL